MGEMMYNATFATNMISERVASDQASHAAVRALIHRFLAPVRLPLPSHHHSTAPPSPEC